MSERDLDELASRCLSYDPGTGVFTRLVGPHKSLIGKPTGLLTVRGYVWVWLGGKRYAAHRLAWRLTTGEWPAQHLDHINGDKTDNRMCNLREATQAQNLQNIRSARPGNPTGLLGVCRRPNGKFSAGITVDHRHHKLGVFETAEEAHAAYVKAKRELHPWGTL